MGSKELYIFLLPESWRLRERGAVYNCPQTYLNIYIYIYIYEFIDKGCQELGIRPFRHLQCWRVFTGWLDDDMMTLWASYCLQSLNARGTSQKSLVQHVFPMNVVTLWTNVDGQLCQGLLDLLLLGIFITFKVNVFFLYGWKLFKIIPLMLLVSPLFNVKRGYGQLYILCLY